MHAKIIHLSSTPFVGEEDFANLWSLCGEDFDKNAFVLDADYFEDETEMKLSRSEADDLIKEILDMLPKGIFSLDMEKRTLTVHGKKDRDLSEIEKWWKDVQDLVSETTLDSFCSLGEYHIREKVKWNGHRTAFLVDGQIFTWMEFIRHCVDEEQQSFHIGSLLGYHY